jgi:hypothetical protein
MTVGNYSWRPNRQCCREQDLVDSRLRGRTTNVAIPRSRHYLTAGKYPLAPGGIIGGMLGQRRAW